MKIAVVGTGISGMVAAYLLSEDHDVMVFDANGYVGGHTHTIDVHMSSATYAVDTGFIVFNNWTYPNFVKLLGRLGVESQPSEMSFSVRCDKTGLEYNGTSINALFAQRRNLLRPSFYRMIREILRFNREAPALLQENEHSLTLGQYLEANHYSLEFVEQYLVPMGAAIWSAEPSTIERFPAKHFVQFFHNHGMLSVDRRPLWRVIKGGSKEYVKALTRPYRERIRLHTQVLSVKRTPTAVSLRVKLPTQEVQQILVDQVIIATHSDQALAMLADPTQPEREILGAIRYQENEAILHTDATLLPRRRLAWASWNYHLLPGQKDRVAVTYHMNTLQGIRAPYQFCVTLNHSATIDPNTIIRRLIYHHPVYTREAFAAQKRHAEINGANRTYFCGAYWGYGFHEDGVNSALEVCKHFDKGLAA